MSVAYRLPAPVRHLLRFAYEYVYGCAIRLRPRPHWPGDYERFPYQSRYNNFDIQPGEVVLDVGSGGHPFPLATILADSYPGDSPHRSELLVRDERPFLICDIQNLPFKNKSIDFVCCSHILEHVDGPIKACLEIMRVGKRGYIETPTFATDALFAQARKASHRWHVTSINNTLLFFEYNERQKSGIGSSTWWDTIYCRHYEPLQKAYFDNQDIFYTMLMWRDSFRVFVFRLDGRIETTDRSDVGIRRPRT